MSKGRTAKNSAPLVTAGQSLTVQEEHGARFIEFAGMRIGEVPLSALKLKRPENYRRMSEGEFASLRTSIDKLGFKSLTLVERGENPGEWLMLDGRHRWKAAEALGKSTLAVVELEADRAEYAGRAMLSFNVHGSPLPDLHYEFLKELIDQMGVADVAPFTGLNAEFLDGLLGEVKDAVRQIEKPDAFDESGGEGGGKKPPEMTLVLVREQEAIALVRAASGLTISSRMQTRCAEMGLVPLLLVGQPTRKVASESDLMELLDELDVP